MKKLKILLIFSTLFAFVLSMNAPIATAISLRLPGLTIAASDHTKPKIRGKADFGKYIATKKTVSNSSIVISIVEPNLKSVSVTKNAKKIAMPAKKKFTAVGTYVVTARDKSGNKSVFQFTIKKVIFTHTNLMPLYYNLIDYLRSTSLGGTFVTSTAERNRVKALVKTYWASISKPIQNTLIQAAQAYLNIKLFYQSCSSTEKAKVRKGWKAFVLSPNFIYAPLNNPKTYLNQSTYTISFNYPGSWSGDEATDGNSIGWLFLYKTGTTATWTDVMNAKTSPTGSLSAIFPVTDDVNGKSALAVARLYAKAYAPTFKEINHIETTLGAVVVINGKFAGQTTEKFFWIVVIPGGTQNYSMSRMGGKVSEAASLVPAYYNMLNTLNWSATPVGSGSGSASDAFGTAWSRVSTAVVANIWAPSDNGGY
ncbi:MAG: hypothetical protein WCL54_02170 [Clostridia bacterium]